MYRTLPEIEAARETDNPRYNPRDIHREYAGDLSAEVTHDIESELAPGRRLPLDRVGRTCCQPANLRGNMPRNERKPLTPPVVPGVLARELRIARSAFSRLETVAERVYPTLTHEARVLLRLLDHAWDDLSDPVTMFSVEWQYLLDAFRVDGSDTWEPVAALWKAVDELIEAQVACIIPGAQWGGEFLFVAEHGLRSMLRAKVLHDPEEICCALLQDIHILNAINSLEQPKAA